MSEFLDGFKKGLRETPRGYFAPLVALLRWLSGGAARMFAVTDRAITRHPTHRQR